jgi:Ca2+-binding RTX toxin-like protein
MAVFKGGNGNDTTNGTGDRDTIYGGAGNDTLFGLSGNDTLYGGTGDDILDGGEGDDQLSGDQGADQMTGGNGNDSYFVDDAGDVVIEAAGGGIDTVHVIGLSNYRLSSNVEIGKLGGIATLDPDGFQNLRGNSLDNGLQGNASRNQLVGEDGDDTLFGYDGDDLLNGGSGNDHLNGGNGQDMASYKVGATSGVNVDLARQGVFQDTGGAGSDKLEQIEDLEGTAFADRLLGDAGANRLLGAGGGDFYRGRAGNDELNLEAGADTIRFEAAGAANGVDTIRGFNAAEDVFQFSRAEYSETATLTLGSAAVGTGAQFIYDAVANTLSYDADGEGGAAAIVIANILPDAALTQANFTFV